MGRRERKRERTRETIAWVAYRLFREHGYDETTVDMIAAEAEVSPRTFYRYFESKDGVLSEGGFEVVDRVLRPGPPPRDVTGLVRALAAAYDELAERNDFEQQSELLRRHPRLATYAPMWRQRWAEHLAAGLAEQAGRAEPTVAEKLVSTVTLDVLTLAVSEWLSGPDGAANVTDRAERVLELLPDLLRSDRP